MAPAVAEVALEAELPVLALSEAVVDLAQPEVLPLLKVVVDLARLPLLAQLAVLALLEAVAELAVEEVSVEALRPWFSPAMVGN